MLQTEKSFKSNTAPPSSRFETFDLIVNQVAADLSAHLKQSKDERKRNRLISEKTGIHQKTLNRIINLENKPTPATVFKIYRYLTQGQTDDEILSLCPEIIRTYLTQYLDQRIEKNLTYFPSYALELQTNPVFGEIYVLCSSGSVSREEILKRFGDYGLSLADEMTHKKILQPPRPGHFGLGQLQIHLTPECILSLGLLTAKNYAKPVMAYEHNHQFMAFIAEGLSETAYRMWLEIDTEAFAKKMDIVRNPQNLGTNKVFTFTATDTLIPNAQQESE